MALLEIKNLSFSYPDANKTISNLSLEVNQGEFIVLTGPTGSGKSTLLKLIKKEVSPQGILEGNIYFDGLSLSELQLKRSSSEIGYVMQNPEHQIVSDRVYHELAFGLENLGLDFEEIKRRVGETSSFFGINSWFRKETFSLSGGEKQILVLASILAMRPKLLLLDEPTSELDPIAAEKFVLLLAKINQELGLTIIIVEHRLDLVLPLADRLLVLDKGSILYDGKPREISLEIKPPFLLSLPSATKIFRGLSGKGECPLTVREGFRFISQYKKQSEFPEREIKKLDKIIYDIKDLHFSYGKGEKEVLSGLNLQIYQGEILTLVGGNGSGKSTLLKLLVGIYKPFLGKILFQGRNLRSYKDQELYQENLAYLPQSPQDLFLEFSVKEEINDNFEELKTLELDSLINKHPYDLSGGEMQRLALGKILLKRPKIIFLDEPTSGLDPVWKEKFLKIFKELQRTGVTIIIVSHDLEFAARVATRAGMIFDGKINSLSDPITFFSNNTFYTTPASRIARSLYPDALTEEEVIRLAKLHGVKDEDNQ